MRYLICFLTMLIACRTPPDFDFDIPFTPVKVRTATVSPKLVGDNLSMTGIIANHACVVRNEVAGWIIQSHVQNGDVVSAGDTLLSIENAEVRYAALLAEANYERIRLHYESERLGYDTKQSDTLADALEYISGLKEARLKMDLAMLQNAKLFVIARSSGVVSGLKVVQGTHIEVGQKLCEILPGSGGLVQSYFLENEWASYRKGIGARIQLADGRIFDGVLTDFMSKIDEKGRFESFWKIDTDTYLPPGMSATIRPGIDKRPSIIVPVSAVGGHGKSPVIFSVVNDTARWNRVELKWYKEDSVEVVKGLEEGMKIILSGHAAVHDGTPVAVYSENNDHGNPLSVTVSNLP